MRDGLERFATGRYNEPRSLFFYAPIVAGGLLPWTQLLAATVPALWARLRPGRPMSPTDWRLLLWAALPLLFYSVSVGKQPRYVLSALPPLALVMAAAASARLARATPGAKHDRLLAWCATASAVALVLVALLLWRASPLVVAVAPVAGLAAFALLAASGLALGIGAWRGRPHTKDLKLLFRCHSCVPQSHMPRLFLGRCTCKTDSATALFSTSFSSLSR